MIENKFIKYRALQIQNITQILNLAIQKVAEQTLSIILCKDINPYALFNILNGAVSKPYQIKERTKPDGLAAGYIVENEDTTSDSYKPLIINFEKQNYYIKREKCESGNPNMSIPNFYDKIEGQTTMELLTPKWGNETMTPMDLESPDSNNLFKVMVNENDKYLSSDLDIIRIINDNNIQPYHYDHLMGYINEFEQEVISLLNNYFKEKISEYSTDKQAYFSNIVTHGSYVGLLSKNKNNPETIGEIGNRTSSGSVENSLLSGEERSKSWRGHHLNQKGLHTSSTGDDPIRLNTWRTVKYPKPPIRVFRPFKSSFTLDTADEVASYLPAIEDGICY